MHTQFAVDIAGMGFDGGQGDEKLPGDLGVGEALGQELENL
jgi:hypothetical protein